MKINQSSLLLIIALIFNACSKDSSSTTSTPSSNSKGSSTTPASPVAQPAVTNSVTSTGFTASWAKVAGAAKYLVYVATDNLFQQPLTAYNPVSVTDTSLTINNLNAATNYYYRVQSSEDGIVSAYSNTVAVTTVAAKQTTWQPAGLQGFSAGGVVYNTSLALDNQNTLYIAYQDGGNNGAATVMMLSGRNWVQVGKPGFSSASIGPISIAIDKTNNTPYVAYQLYDGYVEVDKFVNNSWTIVNNLYLATASQPSIAIDNKGTPYIAVSDYANSEKASVMKYNGTTWIFVGGQEAFSAETGLGNVSLALDGSGNPYIAYDSGPHGTTVQEFNGKSWIYLGASFFNGGDANFSTIAINNNIPYVGFANQDGAQPECSKFSNGYWAEVGSSFIGYDYYPSFTLDATGTPYLVFQQNTDAYHSVSVMKYGSTGWAALGNTSFSGGYIGATDSYIVEYPPSIIVDTNGVVYVAYADDNAGAKATVMKLVQ